MLYLIDHFKQRSVRPTMEGYRLGEKDETAFVLDDRKVVVEWMMEVCYSEGVSMACFDHSVLLFDLFMTKIRGCLIRPRAQLLAIACMLISGKTLADQDDEYGVSIGRYIELSNNSYRHRDVVEAEANILNLMGYDVFFPTSIEIAENLLLHRCRSFSREDTRRRLVFDTLRILLQSALNYEIRSTYTPYELATAAIHISARNQDYYIKNESIFCLQALENIGYEKHHEYYINAYVSRQRHYYDFKNVLKYGGLLGEKRSLTGEPKQKLRLELFQ